MERLGINARSQQENQGERESMAENVPNPGPETSQFSFPRMQDNVAPTSGQQVFATAQWRPKEPPMFTGAASDDVYPLDVISKVVLCVHVRECASGGCFLQQLSFVEQAMSGIWAMKGVMGTDHPGIGLP